MNRPDQRSAASPEAAFSALGRTTAVLLCPEPRSTGNDAHQQLADRGWAITTIHHPHQAMAELCVLEKDQASRSAWGLPRADHLALVINWPDASRESDLLQSAVARYLPEVNIWLVRSDSVMSSSGMPLPPVAHVEKPQLETPPVEESSEAEPLQPVARPFAFSANLSSQETSNGGMAARSVGGAPPLHLVHADLPLPARPAQPTADAELDPTDEPAEAPQRITREEIDMLLQQEAGEQSS